jgi:hypothetical protein
MRQVVLRARNRRKVPDAIEGPFDRDGQRYVEFYKAEALVRVQMFHVAACAGDEIV